MDLERLLGELRKERGAGLSALLQDEALQAALLEGARWSLDHRGLDFPPGPRADLRLREPLEEVVAGLCAHAPASAPVAALLQARRRTRFLGLGDPPLAEIADSCPDLEELTLDDRTLADLDALRALPNLRRLRLQRGGPWGDLADLACRDALQSLLLHGPSLEEIPDLSGFSALRELTVGRLNGQIPLGRVPPGVEALRLSGSRLWDPAFLDGLPRLTSLHLSGGAGSVAWAERCPRVRDLHLSGHEASDLSPLRALPLESLSLVAFPQLSSLRSLAGVGPLKALHLSRLPRLKSLEGMPPVPAATSFRIAGQDYMGQDLRSLADVNGIDAALPAVERLSLRHLPALRDISALARLPKLRALNLEYCKSLDDGFALAAIPDLRAASLQGTRIRAGSLPTWLKRVCSWRDDPDLLARAEQPRPQPGPPRRSSARPNPKANLKRMLLAREPGLIDQGIELAAALGDPALFDDLLRPIQPSEPLRGGIFTTTYAPYALYGLLAVAPDSSAEARRLREKIGGIYLNVNKPERGARPIDLARLFALPGIGSVMLAHAGPLRMGGPVPPQLALRDLRITSTLGFADLSWLNAPQLKDIHLQDAPGDALRGIAGAPNLEAIALADSKGLDLAPLAQSPALQSFGLYRCPAARGWEALASLPRLRSLIAITGDRPASVPAAALGSPTLEHVELDFAPAGEWPLNPSVRRAKIPAHLPHGAQQLARFPGLRDLTLDGENAGLAALNALPRLEQVREARVKGSPVDLRFLERLPGVEKLQIDIHRARDLGPLLALPALQELVGKIGKHDPATFSGYRGLRW